MKLRRKKEIGFILLLLLCALAFGCRLPDPLSDRVRLPDGGYKENRQETLDNVSGEEIIASGSSGADGFMGSLQESVAKEQWEKLDFDPLYAPYFGMLNEGQQSLYRQIYFCASEGVVTVKLCESVRTEELEQVMEALHLDQPELFWLEESYEYRHISGQVTEISLCFNDLADDLETSRARFEAAAEGILSRIPQESTAAEKERLVHDRILENTVYDRVASHGQNAYSALVEGRSVCAGYVRAFQYLLMRLEIPCYYCVGTALSHEDGTDGDLEDHAWNLVKLGDSFYHVDLTWDDTMLESYDVIYYGYYNRTDAEFARDHVRGESAAALPACRGTEYSYSALYDMEAELGCMAAFGMQNEAAVFNLEDYYGLCLKQLTQEGVGEHTLLLMICGDAVMDQVREAVDSGAYKRGYLEQAVEALGLNGYKYSLQLTTQELSGGYYLLIQTHSLH